VFVAIVRRITRPSDDIIFAQRFDLDAARPAPAIACDRIDVAWWVDHAGNSTVPPFPPFG